ncbi:hypothetical protein T02_10190 [Trichinella nativa]|uniref:Uncharacterized protein n=1 Tax=Trichinella nativa TaxID=6335 RepID=A0A0V1L0U8_9BILA|nr:hypothetical protein T02_11905 [Trichinella nativa]KRZ52888.1 hypothetical protein T02_10190 [Trichinella nativa]
MSNYWAHAWYLFETLEKSTSIYSGHYSDHLRNCSAFSQFEELEFLDKRLSYCMKIAFKSDNFKIIEIRNCQPSKYVYNNFQHKLPGSCGINGLKN